MDSSMPGFPVLHYLPKFAQTWGVWLNDDNQPSYPLLVPSPLTLNLSQHQGLFQWVGFSHQVAKVLVEMTEWYGWNRLRAKMLAENIIVLALTSVQVLCLFFFPPQRNQIFLSSSHSLLHSFVFQLHVCVSAWSLSHVQLFATSWTVAHQAALSIGILQARILEWVAMPSSREFPNPGIEPSSPTL